MKLREISKTHQEGCLNTIFTRFRAKQLIVSINQDHMLINNKKNSAKSVTWIKRDNQARISTCLISSLQRLWIRIKTTRPDQARTYKSQAVDTTISIQVEQMVKPRIRLWVNQSIILVIFRLQIKCLQQILKPVQFAPHKITTLLVNNKIQHQQTKFTAPTLSTSRQSPTIDSL